MTLHLTAPTPADLEAVRLWREADAVRAGLRTPYLLTAEQQQAFGRRLAEPGSPHRYWSVREAPASETGPAGPTVHGPLVAFTGLTHIEWENGRAEISLLVAPERRGSGIGAECVRLVLREAFERLRLVTVVAECYHHNPALAFWRRLGAQYDATETTLPRRKWWDGRLHDAALITFTAEGYHDADRAA